MSDPVAATLPPTTPQVARTSAQTLKSTPQSRGSASASEFIDDIGANVDALSPFVERDIHQTASCTADDMLTTLLQLASDNPDLDHPPPPGLLQECLARVLPTCNTNQKLKDAIGEYAASRSEAEYYEPFITACNVALDSLRDVEIDGMRSASDLNILFHRNDPNYITQDHRNQRSYRKPDGVILSTDTVHKLVVDSDVVCWTDYIHRFAASKAVKNLSWVDPQGSIEFKYLFGVKTAIPSVYTVKDHLPTKPEYLPLKSNTLPDEERTRTTSAVPPSGSPAVNSDSVIATESVADRLRSNKSKQSNRTPVAQGANNTKPSGGSGSKRKSSQAQAGSGNNKRPKTTKKPIASVQAGLYAAEMFAANLARRHVFNLVICDDIIWVWFYDRQGNIQSAGINFLQDLPRLLVLLYALQRFELDDWGRHKDFKEAKHDPTKLELRIDSPEFGPIDLTFHPDSDDAVSHFGLKGRATNVIPVTCKALAAPLRIPEDDMMGKLYWGEESRTSEAVVLKQVGEIAEKYPVTVKGHVPELLWDHNFGVSTSKIRRALKIAEHLVSKGSRVLYLLLLRRRDPITRYVENPSDLVTAWWQCILCHRDLWKEGVRHRDISPSNLMAYKLGDLVNGVLNDFDLSSLAKEAGPRGNERTGTIPFMAFDLLTPEALSGEVEHLYRHDLESFVWALVWICAQYGIVTDKDSTHPRVNTVKEWRGMDAARLGAVKYQFLFADLGDLHSPGSSSQSRCWTVTKQGLEWVEERVSRQKRKKMAANKPVENVQEDYDVDTVFGEYAQHVQPFLPSA